MPENMEMSSGGLRLQFRPTLANPISASIASSTNDHYDIFENTSYAGTHDKAATSSIPINNPPGKLACRGTSTMR